MVFPLMAQKSNSNAIKSTVNSSSQHTSEKGQETPISSRNTSARTVSNAGSASKPSKEALTDSDDDSIKIIYSQIGRDTNFGNNKKRYRFDDSSSSLDSECSSDSGTIELGIASSTGTITEEYGFDEYSESTQYSDEEYSSDGSSIPEASSLEESYETNNDGAVVVLENTIPSLQSARNEADIRILSTNIDNQYVEDLARLKSIFINYNKGYMKQSGIAGKHPVCRMRLIHAANDQLWNRVTTSETFPSMDDFRVLANGLRTIERATLWDPSGSYTIDYDVYLPETDADLDEMFPDDAPKASDYRGPIREEFVCGFCWNEVVERIYWVVPFGTYKEVVALIRLLIQLSTVFSREEMQALADSILETMQDDYFRNYNAALIIMFVYNWTEQSQEWRRCFKKRYNAVLYKRLLDNEEEICKICYEKYHSWSHVSTMDCLHSFHSHCLQAWLRESPRCPLCRALPTMPNTSK